MDDEKLKKANSLRSQIRNFEGALASFDSEYTNDFDIPAPMFMRHAAEIEAWMKTKLAELKAQFEAL